MGPGNGVDQCDCDDDECNWLGTSRYSGCYQEEYLFARKDKQLKKIGILKFAGNEMDPSFGDEGDASLEFEWDDFDQEMLDVSYEDLQDQFKTNKHFDHLPKKERGLAREEYQKDIRGRYRKTQKYKHLLEKQNEVFEIEQRGMVDTSKEQLTATTTHCKSLNLVNGRLECEKEGRSLMKDGRFQKGSECKNLCNPGFKLRKNAPVAKKCVCRGNHGCKWIRNAQAKCIRDGTYEKDADKNNIARMEQILPWCVLMEDGKKKLVRYVIQ